MSGAAEIQGQAWAEVAAHDPEHPAACADCGTPLVGPHCHACGQRGHIHRTVPHLLEEIGHGVFHFEGKVWRTLPLLAFRPGELTRRYVHGERTRFVSPLALFLFSVFLMFAFLGSLGGLDVDIDADRDRARFEALPAAIAATEQARARVAAAGRPTRDLDRKIALLRDERSRLSDVPWIDEGRLARIDSGWPALDHKLRADLRHPDLLVYKLKSSAYKLSWALIPLSLPFLWLLFAFRRDVAVYDHAVFATYSLSFMSLLVVIGTLIGTVSEAAGLLYLAVPIHMFAQFRGAYGLSVFGALWRTAAMLCFCLVAILLFTLLIFALDLWH